MTRLRSVAWILIVIADVGLLAWGAMAALAPQYLLGPGLRPILPAEYEGFTRQSWEGLAAASPLAPAFMTVLFRVYGAFNVAFGLVTILVAATAFRDGQRWAWWALLAGNTIAYASAMMFDWTVNAIGPFEMTEYLGLAIVYVALAATARRETELNVTVQA